VSGDFSGFWKGGGAGRPQQGKRGKLWLGLERKWGGMVIARFWQRGSERPVPWRKWVLWFFNKGRGVAACKEDPFFVGFFGF